ncbi:MAG: hemolysin family protein [Acidimicrobiia bacterium]
MTTIDTTLRLLAVLLLIGGNAVFCAGEFALVTVDRGRVEAQAEAGSRRSKLVLSLLRHLALQLSGTQLGITLTSIVLGFIAEPVIGDLLGPVFGRFALAAALVVATVAELVLGELIPKNYAVARPEPTVRALAPFLRAYGLVFAPVIKLLNAVANWVVRRIGLEPKDELSTVRTLDEYVGLIASSQREGTLDEESARLLARSIRFGTKTAADALVPRLAMETLPATATITDLARAAVEKGYSRFPVVGDDLDHVLGVVIAKDVFRVPVDARDTTLVTTVMSEPIEVPESHQLDGLLLTMRELRKPMAIVIDEFGGIAGLITIEDVIEEIVGDIEDEYDLDITPAPKPKPAVGTLELDAALHPDEVEDLVGLQIPEGEYETLAGFVLTLFDRIPSPGEQVTWDTWSIEVLEMDRRRIARVAFHLVESSGQGGSA